MKAIIIITFFAAILITSSCDVSIQKRADIMDGKQEEKSRVSEEPLGNGVTILTVDSHEYIHYRDDYNAASTGGLVHKVDCKHCTLN